MDERPTPTVMKHFTSEPHPPFISRSLCVDSGIFMKHWYNIHSRAISPSLRLQIKKVGCIASDDRIPI
jgi:hypothetical protein